MNNTAIIKGFSRLKKEQKMEFVASRLENPEKFLEELRSFWHSDPNLQKKLDEFSENTLTNYYMPYGIAPNFLINNKQYIVPMVVEESSVVAAAAKSAKFWAERGGFHATVISMVKLGHVYFTFKGDSDLLFSSQSEIQEYLVENTAHITERMRKRGGGIIGIEFSDMTDELEDMFRLKAAFNTVDSMGANFINSCLEEFSNLLPQYLFEKKIITAKEQVQIVMAILSNYTPDCRVKCFVECGISALDELQDSMTGQAFAEKFEQAVKIANTDPHRATTHNKGIFNGIDAVALATGNDFRAIEACAHTYASRDGKYKSLTDVRIYRNKFRYILEIPLAMGTVGGVTRIHPLARRSLEILDNPGVKELMEIAASTGLANNFSAVSSLITTGIQKGHMKMHLKNILNYLNTSQEEKDRLMNHFIDKTVSFADVKQYLENIRSGIS